MSAVLAVLSIVLNLAGAAFIFAAALGVLRFKDTLQRMHASTKAGTVGAGLILAGTALSLESTVGRVLALVAILFLFLTVPIAGHLLGRAAYVSGSDLVGVGGDALKDVLKRRPRPLEREE